MFRFMAASDNCRKRTVGRARRTRSFSKDLALASVGSVSLTATECVVVEATGLVYAGPNENQSSFASASSLFPFLWRVRDLGIDALEGFPPLSR
jgi:hypothetical protein